MDSKWIKFLGITLIVILAGLFVFSSLQKDEPPAAVEIPTTQPSATPLPPETVDIFSGLIFKNDEGLFQVNNSGTAEKIAECSADVLNTDGKSMFYHQDGDIWQLDLETCEAENITNTLASWEVNPQVWAEQTDILFYGVDPVMSAGAPALFNLSNDLQVFLDGPEGWTNSGVAPSPDGNQIALHSNSGPAIYDLNKNQLAVIDLSSFDLNEKDFGRIEAPSWSPDGNKLAWVVGYQGQIGHLILDFESQNAEILHLYIPVGRGGWPRPAIWSPDGNWLIADVWADGFNQEGLYILASDGSKEYFAGSQYGIVVWSPDSQLIIYSSSGDSQETHYFSVSDGSSTLLPLPSDGRPVAWLSP